jgi:hypothetical protein
MMLASPEKRYCHVITERVLDLDYTGVPGAMTAQLVRLREAMLLDQVSVGVIPTGVPPLTADRCEFVIYGERLVVVELPTEDVRYEPPGRDFHRYVELFDRMEDLATHGDGAVELVQERLRSAIKAQPAMGLSDS